MSTRRGRRSRGRRSLTTRAQRDDLGGDALDQLARVHLEEAVRVAAGGPDPLVAQQRLVEQDRQAVAERRHAADRVAGRGADLVRRRDPRLGAVAARAPRAPRRRGGRPRSRRRPGRRRTRTRSTWRSSPRRSRPRPRRPGRSSSTARASVTVRSSPSSRAASLTFSRTPGRVVLRGRAGAAAACAARARS